MLFSSGMNTVSSGKPSVQYAFVKQFYQTILKKKKTLKTRPVHVQDRSPASALPNTLQKTLAKSSNPSAAADIYAKAKVRITALKIVQEKIKKNKKT